MLSHSTGSKHVSDSHEKLVALMSPDTASGEHCAQCWGIISAVEDSHRNENGAWEHDECPED
jgi:hypothetical protein